MTDQTPPIYPIAPGHGPEHQKPRLSEGTSLTEARAYLSDNLEDGTVCPCCDQYAKVYRRKINKGQAKSLIRLYHIGRNSPHGWVHVSDLGSASREEGKLVHWGLVEEGSSRPDGGRGGWWRITDLGREFVRGITAVPKYVWIYNARPVDRSTDELVSIVDVLDDPFVYSDLMGKSA